MRSSSCCFRGEHLRHATEYDARVVTGFEIEKCEGKRKFLTPASCSDFSRLVCLRPFDKGDYKGRASANREPFPRRRYLPNEKSARSRERFAL